MNDNRNYTYDVNSNIYRREYAIIAKWLPTGSRVIDLGCGEGSLLSFLRKKNISGVGVDVSSSGIQAAKKKNLKAYTARIDIPLKFKDNEFDFAICNVTLQMVMYPEILLLEMRRIANRQIISFPNFAFLLNRMDLLFNGRMPRVMIPGYKWYSTGHIHQLSLADFIKYCEDNKLKILDQYHIYPKQLYIFPRIIFDIFPNIFATTGLFLTGKKS